MPFDLLKSFDFDLWRAGSAAAALAIAFALSALSQYKAVPLLMKLAHRLPDDWLGELLHAINRPLAVFWVILGAQISLTVFFAKTALIWPLIFRLCYLSVATWAACKACGVVPVLTRRHDKNAESIKKLIRIGLKALVLSFAAVILLGELGYNVNGLITGLGLGGLTISLAAKDSAANLFAGVLLLIERPFEVGDWISCASAEGTIEEISLRSTKIRTFANTLSVVPNTLISAAPLTNVTRMKMRIKQFTIGVTYNTPRSKLEAVIADIRALLESDRDVAKDTVQVRLTGFSASSIDIMVLYYTTTTVYKEWLAVTERLNLELLDIMHRNEVEFAFPSHSVYLENAVASSSAT